MNNSYDFSPFFPLSSFQEGKDTLVLFVSTLLNSFTYSWKLPEVFLCPWFMHQEIGFSSVLGKQGSTALLLDWSLMKHQARLLYKETHTHQEHHAIINPFYAGVKNKPKLFN